MPVEQEVQVDAPMAETVPTAHSVQPTAPVPCSNVPGAQLEQLAEADEEATVPAAQLTHMLDPAPEYMPGAHESQNVPPVPDWKEPA